MGDRSENAEYIYGKRQLREIDSRIQFLSKRLDELQVIDQLPADKNKVFFGAWVTLETDDGETHRYRLVGADEFDVQAEYISIDAPLARALIGKGLDDEVSLADQSPQGTPRLFTPGKEATISHYVITDICYTEN